MIQLDDEKEAENKLIEQIIYVLWAVLFFVAFVYFVLTPSHAHANEPGTLTTDMVFCASGFGDADQNGTYTYAGVNLTGFDATHPLFENGVGDHSFGEIVDPFFVLSDQGANIVFFAPKYSRSTAIDDLPQGEYLVNSGDTGTEPGGTLTLGPCGGGGGGTATSTPLTYEEDIYLYCVALFFLSFPVWRVMFSKVSPE